MACGSNSSGTGATVAAGAHEPLAGPAAHGPRNPAELGLGPKVGQRVEGRMGGSLAT